MGHAPKKKKNHQQQQQKNTTKGFSKYYLSLDKIKAKHKTH